MSVCVCVCVVCVCVWIVCKEGVCGVCVEGVCVYVAVEIRIRKCREEEGERCGDSHG